MRLEGPRTHLAEVLGWERALRLWYPDWFRALPVGEIDKEDFQRRLKKIDPSKPWYSAYCFGQSVCFDPLVE